jgi:hypothetical protein
MESHYDLNKPRTQIVHSSQTIQCQCLWSKAPDLEKHFPVIQYWSINVDHPGRTPILQESVLFVLCFGSCHSNICSRRRGSYLSYKHSTYREKCGSCNSKKSQLPIRKRRRLRALLSLIPEAEVEILDYDEMEYELWHLGDSNETTNLCHGRAQIGTTIYFPKWNLCHF